MKRFFFICLVLLMGVMGVVLLAGCKNDTNPDNSGQDQNAQAQDNQNPNDSTPSVSKETILSLINKGEKVTECSYDFTFTEGAMKKTSKCYYKDRIVRSEHGNMIYIIDQDGVTEFSLTTRTGRYLDLDDYDNRDNEYNPVSFIQRFKSNSNQNFTFERTETYDGVECYVITVTGDPEGPYKAWVQTTTGLFVKVDGGQDTFEFKNVKTGSGTVPPLYTEVPDSIVIE